MSWGRRRGNAVVPSPLARFLWQVYREQLTPAGRWFFWISLAFSVYGASTLDIQAYVPFCYAAGLWGAAAAAAVLFRPHLRLRASHAPRVCAGETLPVEVEIESLARVPPALLRVVPHRAPHGLRAVPVEGVEVPPLRRGERCRLRLGLRCLRRGVYRLPGFRAETAFPFGLLNARRVFADERPLVVYPRFTPLTRLSLPSGRRYHPGGVALASHLGDSFEYLGNREYREGDSPRDLDWRATARLGRPVVREYREEYFLRAAVILDTCLPPESAGGREADFEQAVSLVAAIGDYMARQEYLVDLFAAGPDLYHLTAGRSLAYLDQILDILACVEPAAREPFSLLEPEIGVHLSRLTTVICVLLDWNPERQAFVEKLQGHGTTLRIVVVHSGAPTLRPPGGSDAVLLLSPAEIAAGIEEL